MARIIGTSEDDNLGGTKKADHMEGLEGNDFLYGFLGDDFLTGGPGNDELEGSYGKDSLVGGKGRDTFDGGVGTDRFEGGSGNDLFAAQSSESATDKPGPGFTDTIVDFTKGDQVFFEILRNDEDNVFFTFDDLDSNDSGAINGKDVGVDVVKGNLVFDLGDVFRQYEGDPRPGIEDNTLVIQHVTSLNEAAIATDDSIF